MAPNTVVGTKGSMEQGSLPEALTQLTFLVEIPGVALGQFSECTGLAVEYEYLEYAEGGHNDYTHRLRGRAKYPVLSLRRGVTVQDGLLTWFFTYQNSASRPTLTVKLLDTTLSPIRQFAFASAFPIRWSGPNVTAGGTGAATESLDIGHLGMIG